MLEWGVKSSLYYYNPNWIYSMESWVLLGLFQINVLETTIPFVSSRYHWTTNLFISALMDKLSSIVLNLWTWTC